MNFALAFIYCYTSFDTFKNFNFLSLLLVADKCFLSVFSSVYSTNYLPYLPFEKAFRDNYNH